MSQLFGPQQTTQKKEDPLTEGKKTLRLVRAGTQVVQDLKGANPERAVQHAIAAGLKLASSLFYDPLVSPIRLLEKLKEMGPSVLVMEPEALMATIDQKYGDWTAQKAADAIETFHRSGFLQTDVPPLVRQKIYAIRIASTSDAPYTEWNVFEKVGGVFNDRLAQFAVVEPLSAAECVKTMVDLVQIRFDTFTNEINIYVAACCHEAGLYTVKPVYVLSHSEDALQQMNYEQSGERGDSALIKKITERFDELKKNASMLDSVDDDSLIEVQARKLLALDRLSEA